MSLKRKLIARKKYKHAKRVHGRLGRLKEHHLAVPIGVFLGLTIITLAGFLLMGGSQKAAANNAMIVIVSHDGVQQTVPSNEPTVGALLSKLRVKLNQGDVVEPSVSTSINQDEFRINVYRAVPVEIVNSGHATFTFSAATTPRSVAAQAGEAVFPEDDLSLEPTSNFVRDGAIGERLIVVPAMPVHLNLYGTELDLRTHAKTVGDLLHEKGIDLHRGDSVSPDLSTLITADQQIFILHKGVKIVSTKEAIPMPVQTKYSTSLAYGEQAVRQQGSPGIRVTTYQIQIQNGKEVSRTVIQTVVVQPAVTQIVIVGTSLSGIKGDMALAGIAPSDYQYVDYIVSHESGWCTTKAQGEIGSCPAYTGYVPSYGGYGLCQSTPGSKMETAGPDWATNPITQLRWCSGYAAGRYGSWQNAYSHWLANGNW